MKKSILGLPFIKSGDYSQKDSIRIGLILLKIYFERAQYILHIETNVSSVFFYSIVKYLNRIQYKSIAIKNLA